MHQMGPRLSLVDKPKVLSIVSAGFPWASQYAAIHQDAWVLSMDLPCFIRRVPESSNHEVHAISTISILIHFRPETLTSFELTSLAGELTGKVSSLRHTSF